MFQVLAIVVQLLVSVQILLTLRAIDYFLRDQALVEARYRAMVPATREQSAPSVTAPAPQVDLAHPRLPPRGSTNAAAVDRESPSPDDLVGDDEDPPSSVNRAHSRRYRTA